MNSVATLVEGLKAGDRRAVARLISLVEDGAPEASEAIREVYPLTGHASTIGLTGAPGAGKSSLIDGLVRHARAEDLSVGVIACDPTSPFSGGALLGDRVRMQDHALDQKVFIRSMATRGHLGGLSLAAPEAMRVLEAAGSQVVIVETVGVGQSEVEVAKQADTTIVVLAPGMGDAIQAAKAGILEIADIFCVNKSDKDGACETARDVRGMLELGHGRDPDWDIPIIVTSATEGRRRRRSCGRRVRKHEDHLREGGRLDVRRRERFAAEIREIVGERLKAALDVAAGADVLEKLTDDVLDAETRPLHRCGGTLETIRIADMRLDGKVAIVVGAGQTPGETIGNGRATAIAVRTRRCEGDARRPPARLRRRDEVADHRRGWGSRRPRSRRDELRRLRGDREGLRRPVRPDRRPAQQRRHRR